MIREIEAQFNSRDGHKPCVYAFDFIDATIVKFGVTIPAAYSFARNNQFNFG